MAIEVASALVGGGGLKALTRPPDGPVELGGESSEGGGLARTLEAVGVEGAGTVMSSSGK